MWIEGRAVDCRWPKVKRRLASQRRDSSNLSHLWTHRSFSFTALPSNPKKRKERSVTPGNCGYVAPTIPFLFLSFAGLIQRQEKRKNGLIRFLWDVCRVSAVLSSTTPSTRSTVLPPNGLRDQRH